MSLNPSSRTKATRLAMLAVLTVGCTAVVEEAPAEPELPGREAANPEFLPDSEEREAPPLVPSDLIHEDMDRTALDPTQLSQPAGVVLEDGRVVSEEEARTGLTAKAAQWTSFRMDGPLFASSMALLPASTHVCMLSLVWGTLYADGGSARVYIEGDRWRLSVRRPSASAAPATATAEATCFPYSNFQTSGGIWYGGAAGVTFSSSSAPQTGQKTAELWLGDAASFLNGVGGKFFGEGERAWIEHGLSPSLASRLYMKTAQGGLHQAFGSSFFVGNPGGTHVAQFIGPNGVGSAQVAGEYAHDYDGRQGWSPFGGEPFRVGHVTMAHSSEAMCYFTSISGRFNGGNEWVQIHTDANGFWRLTGRAKHATEGRVRTRARCYRYRQ